MCPFLIILESFWGFFPGHQAVPCALGSTQPLKMNTWGKDGRCVRVTTLQPSCAEWWADELSFQKILCLLEHADITIGFQIILSISSVDQSLYFFTIRLICRWVSFLCSFVQWFHSSEILRVDFHIVHNFHFLCFLNRLSECLQLETGGQLIKHLPIQPPNQVTNWLASQKSYKPTFWPSIHPSN
jgi:hypothetical protein